MSRTLALGLSALFSFVLAAGPVPDFSLKRLDGSTFRLKDALGKQVIVIDFWATWCGPCTKALKKLQELHASRKDVLVLAISIDDASSMAKVQQFVQGRGYTFPVLLDPDSQVCRLFNPKGNIPFTLVIDRKGERVYQHTGYVPGDEQDLLNAVVNAK